MDVKRFLSSALGIIGIFFIVLTLIFSYFLLTSFIERHQHGSGLLFADVELFGLAVILFGILSAVTIYFSRKLSSTKNNQ